MDELFDVNLTALAYGGEALGRLPDGRAVFVPFCMPGETVRLRLLEEKRGHARAELVEVLEASPQRILPRCAHFKTCGGCHYQHLSYEFQLEAKADILRDQLQRIGGLTGVTVEPAVPSPQAFNYRNYLQFHLTSQGELGFQAARLNDVIPIRECHLPEDPLNAIWPQMDIEPFPGLERISLRLGVDGEVQLVLESSDPQPVDFSVEDLPISAVHLGPGGSLVLAGSDYITMEVLGRPFQVSAASFFQVNTAQAGAMVKHLLQGLQLSKQATLLDVYCGVGLFSAFLAPWVGRLVGIEASPSACEDFIVNLDEFDHTELYQASAEDVLNSLQFKPDVILVDPPRAGVGPRAMDGLLAQEAPWLAYVSCDPSTLSRDARKLSAAGYQLQQVTPFDLFPQTYHIESISFWHREDSLRLTDSPDDPHSSNDR